jgi:pilus assembly protein Flp/PilA
MNRAQKEHVMKWFNYLRSFVRAEEGQDLIEYALLAGLISLVAVAALTTTGTSINGLFASIAAEVSKITPAS